MTGLVIELDELGPAALVRLPGGVERALAESRVIDARPSVEGSGLWEVRAAGWVGVAHIAGVEVRVAPKVPVDRLLFLLGYALDPKGWRDDTVAVQPEMGLLPAFAEALGRQVDWALQAGLLQGYVAVEEALPVVRGRIRESEQTRRRYGQVLPVEVAYDEFTVDVAENRILCTALERMLRVPRVGSLARRRLLHQRTRLAEVTPLVSGAPVPEWQPSRLNQRYWVALRLAEMVLAATSPDARRGGSGSSGFMFSMPKVFEDFVTVALSERLAAVGGRAVRQDSAWQLDQDGFVPLRPDLVWYLNGRPAAVVDAKYKAEKPEGFPNADVYQTLAYCTALGLDRGHLVYAAGNETPRVHVISHAGVDVTAHVLDLALPPAQLLSEVERLADAIGQTSPDEEPDRREAADARVR